MVLSRQAKKSARSGGSVPQRSLSGELEKDSTTTEGVWILSR